MGESDQDRVNEVADRLREARREFEVAAEESRAASMLHRSAMHREERAHSNLRIAEAQAAAVLTSLARYGAVSCAPVESGQPDTVG